MAWYSPWLWLRTQLAELEIGARRRGVTSGDSGGGDCGVGSEQKCPVEDVPRDFFQCVRVVVRSAEQREAAAAQEAKQSGGSQRRLQLRASGG